MSQSTTNQQNDFITVEHIKRFDDNLGIILLISP